ncbi:hypothetical protein H3J60_004543 [Salmonella enterica]|nr:hypothetical protein [Salmonella enterica]
MAIAPGQTERKWPGKKEQHGSCLLSAVLWRRKHPGGVMSYSDRYEQGKSQRHQGSGELAKLTPVPGQKAQQPKTSQQHKKAINYRSQHKSPFRIMIN